MKKIKSIAVIAAVMTIMGAFTGCSDENENSSNSNVVFYDNSSNSYVNPNDIDKLAREDAVNLDGVIGETSTIGAFDINIKNIISVGEQEGIYYADETVEIIAIEIEVKNNSTDTLGVSALGDFKVSVDGGTEFEGLQTAALRTLRQNVDNYSIINGDVEPEQTISGYITFEALKDWKTIGLTYKPQSIDLSYDEISYEITPDMLK